MSVVVGSVPTKEGRAAIRRAATEAQLRKVPLVIVTTTRRTEDDPDTEALRAVIAESTQALERDGLEVVQVEGASGGDVAEDLVAAASEHDAACIVIGLRRRSPVGKLILGSNAQRILLDASCPVLAVKAGPQD